jgi:hypothetical protein
MSFWSRLFGSSGRNEERNTNPTDGSVHPDWLYADCGFCGREQIKCEASTSHLHPVWHCSCGAIGSGAWLPDLDEVGDQLLEILGISSRVSEPCVPTEHPAISIQHYDADKVEHDMAEMLKSRGYEFRVTPRKNPSQEMFWVRKSNAT